MAVERCQSCPETRVELTISLDRDLGHLLGCAMTTERDQVRPGRDVRDLLLRRHRLQRNEVLRELDDTLGARAPGSSLRVLDSAKRDLLHDRCWVGTRPWLWPWPSLWPRADVRRRPLQEVAIDDLADVLDHDWRRRERRTATGP